MVFGTKVNWVRNHQTKKTGKKSLIEIENDTFNDPTMGTFLQIKRSKHKYHLQMKSKHEEKSLPTIFGKMKRIHDWCLYKTFALSKFGSSSKVS